MNTHLVFFLFFSLLFVSLPSSASDLAADRSALLALRDAVGGRSLLWNVSKPSPCFWTGVICSSGRVVELHLPAVGLSGAIPPNTIGNLTQLLTLSLRFNLLTSPLPSDLSSLSSLRSLYLQQNRFSGPIPAFIFSLPNLIGLNLAWNNFSGSFPDSFNNLSRLRTLFLDNNKLTGSIPDLNFPSLVQFNVSNNLLNGPIPSRLLKWPESAFSGNSLCGGPMISCNVTHHGSRKLSGGAIAGIAIGSVVAFLLVLIILIYLCRHNRKRVMRDSAKRAEIETPPKTKQAGDSLSSGFPAAVAGKRKELGEGNVSGGNGKSLVFFATNGKRLFDLDDLLRASAEVLGKGTFGTAYKAVLVGGTTVSVKRLKDVTVPEREFRDKMAGIGAMSHENLVPLRAYYHGRDEKLLVYDYMEMGSLSALLHGTSGAGSTPLNWETRVGIALGAARGIAYVHSQGPTISHGNIKASNILLTRSYESRVSDFGLAQLVGTPSTPNRVSGYRAPEVTDPRKISQTADVYSFGVLLLELLTGKAPTHALLNEDGVDLPRWVQSVVREEWAAEVFDLELLRYQNIEEDMVQLLQLAIDCCAQYPDKRPSMIQVTNQIEELYGASSYQEQDPIREIVNETDEL